MAMVAETNAGKPQDDQNSKTNPVRMGLQESGDQTTRSSAKVGWNVTNSGRR